MGAGCINWNETPKLGFSKLFYNENNGIVDLKIL